MKQIDPKKTTKQLVRFIRMTFRRERFDNALIAVSGGVDSAASLALVVHALGANKVHPVFLPYGTLNKEGTIDAFEFAKSLIVPSNNIHTINIQSFVDPIIALDPHMDTLRRGNIMARIRMIVLYDLTKKLTALVVGTENKTEHLFGYYTRFGDEASDIEPLRHLYKTQVYALARHLDVPEKILHKAPSAGLWKGQTDEREFGFTYQEVDKVLSLHFDEHVTRTKLERQGFKKSLLDRMWYWIEKGEQKERLPVISPKSRVVLS